MSSITVRATEKMGVVGIIDPDAYTAATYLTGAIDMSKWNRVVFIVMAGDLGSSATVDFKVTEASTSGGSYSDISGKAITQLTQAGTDDNKQALVEVLASELGSGKQFIKGSFTVGTATSDGGVIALGFHPRFGPAGDFDLTAVDEIVA
jgi:hypothetical protein